jgi:hypothetical protein
VFVEADHVSAGEIAHGLGGIPVFEDSVFAEERIEDGGAVAGGVDVGVRGAAMVIDEDGLFGGDGGAAEEVFVGIAPMAAMTKSQSMVSARKITRCTRPSPSRRSGCGLRVNVDAE